MTCVAGTAWAEWRRRINSKGRNRLGRMEEEDQQQGQEPLGQNGGGGSIARTPPCVAVSCNIKIMCTQQTHKYLQKLFKDEIVIFVGL